MPKRRRTPRQRAASRRNLEKARAAKKKGIPMGKTALLYRHMPSWVPDATKVGFRPNSRGLVHLTNKSKGSLARHLVVGPASIYSVKVPRKALRKDPTPLRDKTERWYAIDAKHLKGRKIKRVL